MTSATGYPNGKTFNCNGRFVVINDNKYDAPSHDSGAISGTNYIPKMYYYQNNQHTTPTNAETNASGWFINYETE
jgi:hypothetical protein